MLRHNILDSLIRGACKATLSATLAGWHIIFHDTFCLKDTLISIWYIPSPKRLTFCFRHAGHAVDFLLVIPTRSKSCVNGGGPGGVLEALLESSGDSCSVNLAPFDTFRTSSRSTGDRRGLECATVLVDSSMAVHGRFCGGFMLHQGMSGLLKKQFSPDAST